MNLLEPQPKPHFKGKVVYYELENTLNRKGYSKELKRLSLERYAQGLQKYGQPLLSEDGRDNTADALQEMLDLMIYLQKGIMQGKNEWKMLLLDACDLAEAFLLLSGVRGFGEE